MRKVTILLAVAIVAAQSVGCGCCQRLRDWMCRGAYCAAPAPTYAMPVPGPMAAPMAGPMAAPMTTPIGPPSYPMETSFEPGCAYGDGMPVYGQGGWVPSGSGGGVIVDDPGDPRPAPTQP